MEEKESQGAQEKESSVKERGEQDAQEANGGKNSDKSIKLMLLKALCFGIFFAICVMLGWVFITQPLAVKISIVGLVVFGIAVLIKWRGWFVFQLPDNHAVLWHIFGSYEKKPIINSKVYKAKDNGDIVPRDDRDDKADELLLPKWLPKSVVKQLQELIGGWRLIPNWPIGQLMRRRIKSGTAEQKIRINPPYWFISLQSFTQKFTINGAELAGVDGVDSVDSKEPKQIAVFFSRDVTISAAIRVCNLYTYLVAGMENVVKAREYCQALITLSGKDIVKRLDEAEIETPQLLQELWAADILETKPSWDKILKKFSRTSDRTKAKIEKIQEDLADYRTADEIRKTVGLAVASLAISEIEPPKDEQEAMKEARGQIWKAEVAMTCAKSYAEAKEIRTEAEATAIERKKKAIGPGAEKEIIDSEALLNQTAMSSEKPPTIVFISGGGGNPPIAISPDFQSEKDRAGKKNRNKEKDVAKAEEKYERIDALEEAIEDLRAEKE